MKLSKLLLALVLAASCCIGAAHAQVAQSENLTPPASGPEKITIPKQDDADGDDEIVIIEGPKIGRTEKPQLTPAMLELIYRGIWQKVGKEYHDPYKLNDWASWEKKFAGKLKSEEDLSKAVKEMLGSLNDRWTLYTSPSEIAERKQAAKDGYLQIGMLLRTHDDEAWHIDGMTFNTPAMLSRLREGDIVKSINGKELKGLSQAEVSKMLLGKEGEKLQVLASIDGKDESIELLFAKPGPNQVAVGLLPGNIAYIRLPSFMSKQDQAVFVSMLGKIYEGTGGQVNGLIFDLRYNGGGLVTMALEISSLFCENGTVTKTTVRSDRSMTETSYKVIPIPQYLEARMPRQAAEFIHFLQTVPLVVLTNGSSASASEITTGALQDNGRAYVIGVKTFGKAVGYSFAPLPNGSLLQITNLSYLTPSGKNIADKGIEPDLVVEQPRGQEILGDKDEQVKAANEYLLKIAEKRAAQLQEARELSTSPQVQVQSNLEMPKPFVWHGLYILALSLAGLLTLLLAAYAASKVRKTR